MKNAYNSIKNINLTKIIGLLIIAPIIMSFFWQLIGDPLIGKTSARTIYGKQNIIPEQYMGKWCDDDDVCLQVNYQDMQLWQPERQTQSCQAERITVEYAYDNIQSDLLVWFMAALPRTVFGNQRVFVGCQDNANRWVLHDTPREEGCTDLQIQHTNTEYPDNYYLCYHQP